MKLSLLLLFFLLLAFLIPIPISGGYFDIEFSKTKQSKPQTSPYLKPISGVQLLPVLSGPLKQGQMFLRRKFGQNEYALYKGYPMTRYFADFSQFERPRGMRFQELLTLKFYTHPEAPWFEDLDNVFFSEESFYIQAHTKIYYNHKNQWKKIETFDSRQKHLEKTNMVMMVLSGIPERAAWRRTVSARLSSLLADTRVFNMVKLPDSLASKPLTPTNITQVRRAVDCSHILSGSIQNVNQDWFITIRILDTVPNRAPVSRKVSCYGCTEPEFFQRTLPEVVRQVKSHIGSTYFSSIEVISTPAGAEVSIEDTLYGITPFSFDFLRPNRVYALAVKKSGFEPHTDSIAVTMGQHLKRQIVLIPIAGDKNALKDVNAVSMDGASDLAWQKRKRRIKMFKRLKVQLGFGAIAVGALAAGLFLNQEIAAKEDSKRSFQRKYDKAFTQSELERYKKQWAVLDKDVDKFSLFRKVSYIVSGVAAAGIVLVFNY